LDHYQIIKFYSLLEMIRLTCFAAWSVLTITIRRPYSSLSIYNRLSYLCWSLGCYPSGEGYWLYLNDHWAGGTVQGLPFKNIEVHQHIAKSGYRLSAHQNTFTHSHIGAYKNTPI